MAEHGEDPGAAPTATAAGASAGNAGGSSRHRERSGDNTADRKVLGSLTSGQAGGTDRVHRADVVPHGRLGGTNARAGPESVTSSAAVRAPAVSSSAGVISTSSSANATFQIFSDGGNGSRGSGTGVDAAGVDVHPALQENAGWKHLAPDDVRRKENEGTEACSL
jgi:hypothetical protein